MTERLNRVVETLNKLLLMDVRVFDFRGSSPFFDYQVIASGKSERQVHRPSMLCQAFPKMVGYIGAGTSPGCCVSLRCRHIAAQGWSEDYQFEEYICGKSLSQISKTYG